MQLSLLLDFQIITMLFIVVAAWRFGDWKNWTLYYPTILFTVLGTFIYSLVSYNFPLWEFESPLLKTTGSDLLFCLIGFPAAILLYLTYLQKIQSGKKVFILTYILAWVAIFTLIELLSYKLGFFSYHNGWNLGWSLLFNCIMFLLMWLHYRKPPWAWALAVVTGSFIVIYFSIPFSSMK